MAAANGNQKFVVGVAEFVAKAKGKMRQAVVETIQDLAEEVIVRTPVDTGFLRASWYGTLAQDYAPREQLDLKGAAAKAFDPMLTVVAVAGTIELGDRFLMLNNAAYALRLEYGFVGQDSLGRTYNQEGRAFVRGTISEAPRIALEAAQRVGSGQGMGGANKGGGGATPDVGYTAP